MIKRVFPPPIDLVKWYVIKDLMANYNISHALNIAKKCKHIDAVWFFNICKDNNVKSISDLLKVLEPLNDERSLFFKWYLDAKNECCIESAKMGYIHAIYQLNDNSNLKSVEECALKGERDAIYTLGELYKKDKHENLVYAASLNHQDAIYSVNLHYGMCPELRYIIGRARAISQDKNNSSYYYGPFYLSQNESCRKAVDTWSLISTRLRIYKDLRIFIAKMIWDTRFEALY